MKSVALAVCGLVLASLPCTSAVADTFSFDFQGSDFSGSGYLTATEIGHSGTYNISNVYNGSVTGLGNGSSAITGLIAANGFQGNDNILTYPGTFSINSPSYFDTNGVSFSLANGRDVNLFDSGLFEAAVGSTRRGGSIDEYDIIDVDPVGGSPVPEPGSLALLGTGILAAAGAIRRRLTA